MAEDEPVVKQEESGAVKQEEAAGDEEPQDDAGGGDDDDDNGGGRAAEGAAAAGGGIDADNKAETTIVTEQRGSNTKDDCSDLTDNINDNDDTTPKTFPQKLMDILSNEENQHVISWLPHGNGFVIHKKKTFANEVLPKYFKASKFTSFTRKLNRWGFSRVPRGPETGSYYHKLFCRDKAELCLQMTSNSGNKQAQMPMAQHLMPTMNPGTAAGMGGMGGMGMPIFPAAPNPYGMAPQPQMMGNMTPQQQQIMWQQQMQQMMQFQQMMQMQQPNQPNQQNQNMPMQQQQQQQPMMNMPMQQPMMNMMPGMNMNMMPVQPQQQDSQQSQGGGGGSNAKPQMTSPQQQGMDGGGGAQANQSTPGDSAVI